MGQTQGMLTADVHDEPADYRHDSPQQMRCEVGCFEANASSKGHGGTASQTSCSNAESEPGLSGLRFCPDPSPDPIPAMPARTAPQLIPAAQDCSEPRPVARDAIGCGSMEIGSLGGGCYSSYAD
eukprot:SAG31_NODE_16869_length_692_cov_1.185497_1_plen_124_part_10